MSRQIITTTRPDGTRSTYSLQPGSTAPVQLAAIKPLKPSRIKADRRTYPKYKPGMSTAEYVRLYETSNGMGLKTAGYWQPLNTAPAAGYQGIDTIEHGDFDMIPEDTSASEAPAAAPVADLAPMVATVAPAAAPAPAVPAAPAILQAWQVAAAASFQAGAETLAEALALGLACLARFGVAHPDACAHLPSFPAWHWAALAEIRASTAPAPAAAVAPAAPALVPVPAVAPDDAALFRARVDKAAAWIGAGRPTSRAFDACFEWGDGDAVAVALLERAQRRPSTKLAANLWRYLTRQTVADAAARRPAGVSLAEWSRALAQAEDVAPATRPTVPVAASACPTATPAPVTADLPPWQAPTWPATIAPTPPQPPAPGARITPCPHPPGPRRRAFPMTSTSRRCGCPATRRPGPGTSIGARSPRSARPAAWMPPCSSTAPRTTPPRSSPPGAPSTWPGVARGMPPWTTSSPRPLPKTSTAAACPTRPVGPDPPAGSAPTGGG